MKFYRISYTVRNGGERCHLDTLAQNAAHALYKIQDYLDTMRVVAYNFNVEDIDD